MNVNWARGERAWTIWLVAGIFFRIVNALYLILYADRCECCMMSSWVVRKMRGNIIFQSLLGMPTRSGVVIALISRHAIWAHVFNPLRQFSAGDSSTRFVGRAWWNSTFAQLGWWLFHSVRRFIVPRGTSTSSCREIYDEPKGIRVNKWRTRKLLPDLERARGRD